MEKTIEKSYQVERNLVEIINERSTAKGFKKTEFAAKVWSDTDPKTAYAKWNAIRGKVSRTGKPQGLLISDAQRMAEILNDDLAYLIFLANAKAQIEIENNK